jgi:hypothetical protein
VEFGGFLGQRRGVVISVAHGSNRTPEVISVFRGTANVIVPGKNPEPFDWPRSRSPFDLASCRPLGNLQLTPMQEDTQSLVGEHEQA